MSTLRLIGGVKPGAVKAASPVLNGGDEETGLVRPRLVATQLECAKSIRSPAKTQQSSYSERSETMYVSRLTFHTTPGKTHEVEQELLKLMAMVSRAGGVQPRVLRSHLASPGAPDVVFEQEVADLETLTTQSTQVTEREEFQKWSSHMSGLLTQSPKREVYLIVE